jgi:hypothetical protein
MQPLPGKNMNVGSVKYFAALLLIRGNRFQISARRLVIVKFFRVFLQPAQESARMLFKIGCN